MNEIATVTPQGRAFPPLGALIFEWHALFKRRI